MTPVHSAHNPGGEQPEKTAAQQERASAVSRQEALLDQAIEETFPASDPISPMLVS